MIVLPRQDGVHDYSTSMRELSLLFYTENNVFMIVLHDFNRVFNSQIIHLTNSSSSC